MSEPGPTGEDPFAGLPPFFRDLAGMFSGHGALHWDVARQMAVAAATGGEAEPNVDPLERIRLEELLRVADLHVADATGLATASAGRPLAAMAVTRAGWAARTLDDWRPLLERLALGQGDDDGDDPDARPDPMAAMLQQVAGMAAPVLLGMQAGSMVGHLAGRALGQYDLPIPRPPTDELLVVPANIDAFAAAWDLPADDVRLYVCLSEVAHHAVLARPHVRERLLDLMGGYVSSFRVDGGSAHSALAGIDPSDPEALQRIFGDPAAMLGALETPEQGVIRQRIEVLVVAIEGYVDRVVEVAGAHLLPSYAAIEEAARRRRVEGGEAGRFAERLLGLQLGRAQYERGSRFVHGVVERAGEAGLARMWRSARELPTEAELDAPGLWLERIDLPDDPE